MPYQNPFLPSQQFGQFQPQGYMTAGTSPMLTQPGNPSVPVQQQPVHGFVYVTGIDGAKAYQMPPNSEMPLFDSTGDFMYIKTTDGAGFPTIKVCKVRETQPVESATSSEYVTREELDRTYRELAGQLEQMKGVIYGAVPAAAAATEPNTGKIAGNQADDGWQPARHASANDAQ